jgi:hypothetical protein
MLLFGPLSRVYTRAQLKEDSKWILLAAGAVCLQVGAVLALGDRLLSPPASYYLAAGAALAVVAFVPIFWLHFLVIAGGTVFLAADLAMRQNPVGAPFVLLGVYFSYKMVRYHGMAEGKARMIRDES